MTASKIHKSQFLVSVYGGHVYENLNPKKDDVVESQNAMTV